MSNHGQDARATFARDVRPGRDCGWKRQATVLRAQNCRPARKVTPKINFFLVPPRPALAARATAPSYRFARAKRVCRRRVWRALRAPPMDTAATTHAARYLKTEYGQAGRFVGSDADAKKKSLFATVKSLRPCMDSSYAETYLYDYAETYLYDSVPARAILYDPAPARTIWYEPVRSGTIWYVLVRFGAAAGQVAVGGHSTVTLLARLRGLSTLQPRATAA